MFLPAHTGTSLVPFIICYPINSSMNLHVGAALAFRYGIYIRNLIFYLKNCSSCDGQDHSLFDHLLECYIWYIVVFKAFCKDWLEKASNLYQSFVRTWDNSVEMEIIWMLKQDLVFQLLDWLKLHNDSSVSKTAEWQMFYELSPFICQQSPMLILLKCLQKFMKFISKKSPVLLKLSSKTFYLPPANKIICWRLI